MPFCPKCETEYRAGFESCADCDVDLVDNIEPAADLEDVEEDFAREMFAEATELIHACNVCEVEYVQAGMSCSHCERLGGMVRTIEREEWTESLSRSQLDNWRIREPMEGPDGLECVWIALDPAEAGFAATTLGGMGVAAEIGHDGVDDFEDVSRIGIWVAADEAEAARVLIPEDASEWRDDGEQLAEDRDPYADLLRRAESYRGIRKFRHAVALAAKALDVDPGRYEAYVVLGKAAGEMGNFEIAAGAFGDAVERLGSGYPVGREYAAYTFIDGDGAARFTGPVADRGYAELDAYTRANGRDVRALMLFMEAAHERGAKSVVAAAADRLEKVNPGILRLPGSFARMVNRGG